MPSWLRFRAVELGKNGFADREARTSPEVRNPEKMPPIRLPVGNNVPGRDSDFTAVAELGRFEKANPKTPPRSLPRPDPDETGLRGYSRKKRATRERTWTPSAPFSRRRRKTSPWNAISRVRCRNRRGPRESDARRLGL